jgi:hypothetical protein
MPVLKDCNIYFGGYDLTSVANELSIETMYADVDVTTFGSAGALTRVGGLQDSNISLMTFLDPSISEPAFFGDRGGVVELVSAVAFPTGGTVTVGDRCYAARAMLKSISDPMKVGDVAKINATLSGAQAEGVLQGTVLTPKQTVATSTSTGAFSNLGAVAAGQSLYFGVHVFSVTGDRSPTFQLQRNPTSPATTGASVTVISLSRSTTGGLFGSSATVITDPYWRVVCNSGGTTGSVTYAAFAAIQ